MSEQLKYLVSITLTAEMEVNAKDAKLHLARNGVGNPETDEEAVELYVTRLLNRGDIKPEYDRHVSCVSPLVEGPAAALSPISVTQRDLWLCDDCMIAAVNDDYTGLDYYYPPGDADRRMKAIEKGLEALGPGLVPDWREETEYECLDCGNIDTDDGYRTAPDKDDPEESVRQCHCGSQDVREREHGEEEFSRCDCDCCGTDLGGGRHRFAVLGRAA